MAEKIAKGIGIAIAVVLFIFIMLPLGLMLTAAIGYLAGLIVAWAVGGLLTGIIGITASNIPIIFAWLFVASAILGSSLSAKDRRK